MWLLVVSLLVVSFPLWPSLFEFTYLVFSCLLVISFVKIQLFFVHLLLIFFVTSTAQYSYFDIKYTISNLAVNGIFFIQSCTLM